eukprot:m.97720 g.97720  ORF g.97720 m.97720 type:complete len:115 (-) comp12501_c0_seq1:162-506(-)
MSVFHDEVEIEDFDYDEETETYSYPCPCGDIFQITKEELADGEDVARCPSCSLLIRVIYDIEDFEEEDDEDEELTLPPPKEATEIALEKLSINDSTDKITATASTSTTQNKNKS